MVSKEHESVVLGANRSVEHNSATGFARSACGRTFASLTAERFPTTMTSLQLALQPVSATLPVRYQLSPGAATVLLALSRGLLTTYY